MNDGNISKMKAISEEGWVINGAGQQLTYQVLLDNTNDNQ